ncbi:MAG: PAS domain S-box protein [Methanosarcina sp.]
MFSNRAEKSNDPVSYQALLDENYTLKEEIESLRARLQEAEELKRAISEGDLDALVIYRPEGELIFTLDSADRAYRTLVETMNESTVTLACDRTILYCNRHFAELLKIPPRAAVGIPIDEFIAPEHISVFKALLRQNIGTGEINLRTKDGSSVPVYLSTTSLKEEGSPNAWCLVATDLSEQKKNEEIVAAERLARSIIEQTAEAIIVCDAAGKITRFSNAMSRICRFDPIFQRFEDIIDLRFSGGENAGRKICPVTIALKGSAILGVEATLELKDSQKSYLLLSSTPLRNNERKIIGCVVALTDITERKQVEDALRESEERLSIAKEAAKLGIHDYDVISNTIQWDSRLRELWGVSPDDPVTYETFMAGLHPEDRAATQKAVDEALDPAGSGKYYAEYRVINFKDGVEHWIAANGQTFFENFRAVRLIGTVQEITERKRAEEALQKSEKNLAIELDTAKRLQQVSQQLIRTEGIEALYEQILDTATAILHADFASIQMFYPERGPEGELRLLGYRGFNKQAAEFWEWVRPTSQSSCGIALRTCQRIIASDVEKCDSILGSDDLAMYLQTGIRAVQTTPLFSRSGTLLGMLSTHWGKPHKLMEADERNLDILARQAADLIERKQAEDALRKSEERYRLLFTNMTEAFFLAEIICDENGKPYDYRFLELNPAYEYNMGIKREQILGKSVLGEIPKASRIAVEKFGEVALSGKSTNFELFSDVANKYFDIYAFSPEKGKFAAVFRDVTERKKAEEKLKESEEQYRTFFENSIDAILLTSPNGSIFAANSAACQIFGMTEEEIIQAGRNEIVDTSDPRLLPALEERAKTGKFKGELNYRRKDGTIFPGEVSTAFFKDTKGLIKTTMIIRDITERRKAEEALRESEQRFRAVIENSRDAIILADTAEEGKIISVNKAAVEMFGWAEEEMIGLTRKDIIDIDNPNLKENKNFETILQERSSTGLTHCELPYKRKDGSIFPGELASACFVQANGEEYAVSIIRDITERKKIEEALKNAYQNLEEKVEERTIELQRAYESLKKSEQELAEAQKMAHLGNWAWNIVTGEVDCSDETYRILGFKPQAFKLNFETIFNCVCPDDQGFVENSLKKALKGEPYAVDFRISLPDGTERIVFEQGGVVFDENNNPVLMKGTIQDITERRKVEEALAKIDKIRIKEIHHRIKNNLQVISSLLSLEAERFDDEKILEALKESQNRVASMALIHEELYKGNDLDNLDFAVYLRKLTSDLFDSYRIGNNYISLDLDLDQVYLDMDTAIPLGIIVNELVSNALKHAFPRGKKGKIEINMIKRENLALHPKCLDADRKFINKDNYQYIMEVTDNGIGISEEINFRVINTLGLQLVNLLVEQIDGHIELSRGQGTKFNIWFNEIGK